MPDLATQPSVEALLAAARRAGVELVTERREVDGSGLDFVVVQARDAVGTAWIVRAPRRADVVASARTEAKILGLVRPRVAVGVPDWRIHTDEVIAYPRLDGMPVVTLDTGAPVWNVIDPAAPAPRFVEGMATLLAALQAIPPADARAAGIPSRSIAEVRAELARAIAEARGPLDVPVAVLDRWQRWLAGATWPAHTALVHGDLHPGHLLVDRSGALTGVLDWTEAQVTDPSVDLAMFAGAFGRTALEALVAAFAARGGVTWPALVEHALERWAAFPALAAAWALRTGNEGALAFAKHLLQAVSAETPGA